MLKARCERIRRTVCNISIVPMSSNLCRFMSVVMNVPEKETDLGDNCVKNGHLFLFDLILYVPVNNFSVMSDGSSSVGPVLSKD